MMETTVTRWLTVLLALVFALGAAPSRAADPAVARPSFPIDGEIQTKGIVFFVPADTPSGAAALGTAHTFDLTKLVRVRRGDFVLGYSRRVVARATGFLVPPGRPFDQPGAGLPGDYVVYALDSKPAGVRLLALEPSDGVQIGTRVQLLGVPSSIPHDEDDLFGRVVKASPDRIEVDLDVPYDLRGWGGAPVLDERSHRVIGMLQAYFPRGSTSRVILSPIAEVRAALAEPLEGGKGRAFAAFRNSVKDASRERKAAAKPQRAAGSRGSAGRSYPERPAQPLIKQEYTDETRVHLDIEYPPNDAVVGDSACGVFVSGRALALHGELRHFDVILVIDTSRSTVEPTGADINGNGIVGRPYLGRIGSIFSAASTDPGDSILAAEVGAARHLLHGLDPRSTRVGVVSFAGELPENQGGLFMRGRRQPAITLEPLTDDYTRVERALDSIAARDPAGSTHMAAGVDQATVELMGLRGALSQSNPRSEKIVLFFTDGRPTLPYGPGFEADNTRAVLRAANRAQRANIRIHSFAIGPEALKGPVATVEMAARTDGFFTPVRHPGDLVDVVEEVSFANLEEVTLKSLTTGEPADDFRITADGSWAGFIRMDLGDNEVEIRARASDGTEATSKIRVTLVKDAADPPVPSQLVVARNRLLENCLRSLKQVRISVEKERAEQIRKELLVEIERERREAIKRADEQRKQLELEVEEEEPAP
jgi:hypothetical protein